jgi:fungalysin metallopeptidase (M36)/PA domain-containing protein/fungalysin/thermolysin propeptide
MSFMVRMPRLTIPALVFAAAACAACSSSSKSGGDPAGPGGGPQPGDPEGPGTMSPGTPAERPEVSLGMTIMARDAAGAPRLMRAIRPRAMAAGMSAPLAARDHLAALAPLWVDRGRPMALTETGTQELRNGATVVRLAQTVGGVVVDQGEIRVLMHASGALAAVSGTLLPDMAPPSFASSASAMLDRALDSQFGGQRPRPAVSDLGDQSGWQKLEVAPDPRVRVSEARARRVIARDGGALTGAWELEVFGEAPPDPLRDPTIPAPTARRYVIADATGKILGDSDLMQSDAFAYRVYAETTGNRRPLDGPLTDFSPHPTGFPDGSAPTGTVPSNLAVMEAFNGPIDKWLPDTATTTSGNNVNAFSDLDGNNAFSAGDVRPEVRSRRVLDYRYDTTQEPLATQDQIKAGVVNLFFLDNWMHDWWYESGFTERTGNAQVDNLGRGGVGGDPIVALAQAGANNGARDNATMATPADGLSPRQRIFLFTTSTVVALTTPAGSPHAEGFSAAPHAFDLTGTVAIADDGVAPGNDACQPITSDVAGKIALITFSGVCGSAATVNNARAAGAIGVLLADGALEDPRAFAGSAAANLPGVAIGKTDGETLAAAVAAGPVRVTVHSAPFGVERDGDLDSGVSGHEWAHYLHHRLAVCNNGQQCGGMSEGWGDFNGLLLQLRDGDNRDGTYAQGSYADASGTPDNAYFSVRRFPSSRDRTKNALSFRHIADENPLPTTTPGRLNGGANSEVHNAGEVWALMMFEAFNTLIDAHGVPVGRRRITDYSVAGLLLTPPEATFLEARDAILAAASALDTDDMILIAAAFAGRGAGSCAVAPSNAVRTNNGVIESGTLAGKLELGGLRLDPIKPGQSGLLHATIANGGPLTAEQVVVSASTATPGVQIGAPIHIPLLAPFSSADLTIPVKLLPTAPIGSNLVITVKAIGQETCDPAGVSAVLTTPISSLAAAGASSSASLGDSSIVATSEAPATSLDAADSQVCILGDTP